MPEKHKLTVILFADIAGYTALMQKDEAVAMDVLHHFKDTIEKEARHHGGTIMQYFGDGALLVFDGSAEAVGAAMNMQRSFAIAPVVPVRMGIHLGDVLFKSDNVFGDAVNIASRIESMGVPGAVLLSGNIRDQIKNRPSFEMVSLGDFAFKNVEEEIAVYAIANEGFVVPKPAEMKGKIKVTSLEERRLPPEKSIIVLPFENISPNPEQEFFSDGLTEEIITDLSHIHDLLVISRSSAMTFKGSKKKLKEIAREVNVQYVLEGSVRKAGNHLRITAQLIDGVRDTHLWAEKYSGTLDDIFDIQERVSLAITKALQIRLSSTELSLLNKRKINDSVAYEQFLLARYKVWQLTEEALGDAIRILESQLRRMGNNEYIHAALALAHIQLVNAGLDPEVKHLERADELIDSALALNPSCAKAHWLRSLIHELKGNVREAFTSVKKAVEIDPADCDALTELAHKYILVGKPKQAKPYIDRALELDPLNWMSYAIAWWFHLATGDLNRMLQASTKIFDLARDVTGAAYYHAVTLAINNQIKEASEVFDLMIDDSPSDIISSIAKGYKHAINQEKNLALQSITASAAKKAFEKYYNGTLAWAFAHVYSLVGEKDEAINYLERATASIFINYPLFEKHDPFLENIREEPRFMELMKRVKYRWEHFEV